MGILRVLCNIDKQHYNSKNNLRLQGLLLGKKVIGFLLIIKGGRPGIHLTRPKTLSII